MVRKFRHHEKKLLKKVDFLNWKGEGNVRQLETMRRYRLADRRDYTKYNKVVGMVKKLVTMLKYLDPADPFRHRLTDQLCAKLYDMGLISRQKSLADCDKLTVSSFCRRRLATILVRLRFCQHMEQAVRFVEQGHIRVGPQTVTAPDMLISRTFEDYVTWTESSKIRKKVLKYNDKLDDYDALH